VLHSKLILLELTFSLVPGILDKMLENSIQQHIKKIIILHGQGYFTTGMKEWLSLCKSINVTWHTNKTSYKIT
jgi:hypothetical protein